MVSLRWVGSKWCIVGGDMASGGENGTGATDMSSPPAAGAAAAGG